MYTVTMKDQLLAHPKRCTCGKLYFEIPAGARYCDDDGGGPLAGFTWPCTLCRSNLTVLDNPDYFDDEATKEESCSNE